MRSLLFVALILSVIGCDKDKDAGPLDGAYTGTFQRKIASEGIVVAVKLNLNNMPTTG